MSNATREKSAPTIAVDIFIAGDLAHAKQICRAYCFEAGLCVTVTPTDFIYTGGEEAGVHIGLTNYPRFPSTPEQLREKAEELANSLLTWLYQHSVLIRYRDETIWITRRPENA